MKEKQYDEGPRAREKFEGTMIALFRAPKSIGTKKMKKRSKKGKD